MRRRRSKVGILVSSLWARREREGIRHTRLVATFRIPCTGIVAIIYWFPQVEKRTIVESSSEVLLCCVLNLEYFGRLCEVQLMESLDN